MASRYDPEGLKAYHAAYRAAHREKSRTAERIRYARKRDEIRAKAKAKRNKNIEAAREAARAKYATDEAYRERVKERTRKTWLARIERLRSDPALSAHDRSIRYERAMRNRARSRAAYIKRKEMSFENPDMLTASRVACHIYEAKRKAKSSLSAAARLSSCAMI